MKGNDLQVSLFQRAAIGCDADVSFRGDGVPQTFGSLADVLQGELQELLAMCETLFVCEASKFREHDGVAAACRTGRGFLKLGDDGAFEFMFRPVWDGFVKREQNVHGFQRVWIPCRTDVPQPFEREVAAYGSVGAALYANPFPDRTAS